MSVSKRPRLSMNLNIDNFLDGETVHQVLEAAAQTLNTAV